MTQNVHFLALDAVYCKIQFIPTYNMIRYNMYQHCSPCNPAHSFLPLSYLAQRQIYKASAHNSQMARLLLTYTGEKMPYTVTVI